MAKQLTDVLDLEREIDTLRDTLHLVKAEMKRIDSEYLSGPLDVLAVDDLGGEFNTLVLAIENALF